MLRPIVFLSFLSIPSNHSSNNHRIVPFLQQRKLQVQIAVNNDTDIWLRSHRSHQQRDQLISSGTSNNIRNSARFSKVGTTTSVSSPSSGSPSNKLQAEALIGDAMRDAIDTIDWLLQQHNQNICPVLSLPKILNKFSTPLLSGLWDKFAIVPAVKYHPVPNITNVF